MESLAAGGKLTAEGLEYAKNRGIYRGEEISWANAGQSVLPDIPYPAGLSLPHPHGGNKPSSNPTQPSSSQPGSQPGSQPRDTRPLLLPSSPPPGRYRPPPSYAASGPPFLVGTNTIIGSAPLNSNPGSGLTGTASRLGGRAGAAAAAEGDHLVDVNGVPVHMDPWERNGSNSNINSRSSEKDRQQQEHGKQEYIENFMQQELSGLFQR